MTATPWLSVYPPDLPSTITPDFHSILEAFRLVATTRSADTAIMYFDRPMSYAELDVLSDAFAVALQEGGFATGDRLALYTQNDPAFVVGLLAAWKAGGAAVLINPMNKSRELTYLLVDSGACALLCLDDLYVDVAREVIATGDTAVRAVVVSSALDWQGRNDVRVLRPDERPDVQGVDRVTAVIERHRGARPSVAAEADPAATAVLTYTSGTTGEPKGVINTHGGLAFNSQTYREWMRLSSSDVILGVAPLFHITGLVGHVCVSLLLGSKLVLMHRFDGMVVLDAIRENRPTFVVAAITALRNLADQPGASSGDFSSLTTVYSGGAPISPATAQDLRDRTGMVVHNIYGMTETTSPTHAVPKGVSAPTDPASGALSIGVPVFDTTVRIVDDAGRTVPPGTAGELVVSGPQVTPGYWNKPEQTAEKLIEGELHTGDVGVMDEDGWFYLVDRKTDMIIASGYKVWPSEVESVLHSHPAVREAVVVGVDDPYRGETVKAVVSLVGGHTATAEELVSFCRSRLAAYKYPRIVEIVDDLPRNPAGKIVRRALRAPS